MGRNIKVSKETMLNAACEILSEEGYSAVNIKTIAAKVGCSTQPISWQFGNMMGLRKELYEYAMNKMYGEIRERIKGKNALQSFFETGKYYISSAIENPHMYRFLRVDDPGEIAPSKFNASDLGDPYIKEALSKELSLSMEEVDKVVTDVIIYSHGLSVILLWENFTVTKEEAFKMILENGARCFEKYGIDIKKYIDEADYLEK